MTHVTAPKRGFRARRRSILTRVTKYHACHEICTWSPLRAALPMRFSIFPIGAATFCHHKHAQLTGPRATSATRATRNEATSHLTLPHYNAVCNFSHRHGNILPRQSRSHMSQSATPATRHEATQDLQHPKINLLQLFP